MAVGGALRELVAYLGFDLDERGLDKAEKGVEGLKKKSETLTRALETVGLALGVRELGEFISSQIEMGAAIEHSSQMLGVGVEDLQAFQYAAQTTGLNAEEATNGLGFLNKAIGEATGGNAEAAKTFAQLGVSLKNADGTARPLSEVIGDVADGFAKTDNQGKKTVAAMALFGRSGRSLIPLLSKGREGVQGLYDEFDRLGGGLSEDFIATAEESEHSMVKLKTAARGLSSEIGAALLPYVSDLASSVAEGVARFREWTKNSHLVRNALITLAAIAGILVITWGILNIEILLVVAALALLALAVDDVITFFEGGDSLLGRFLDKLYGLGGSKKIAQDLRDAWKEVSEAFGKLWDAIKELGPTLSDLFDTFTKNKGDMSGAKTGIQSMADTVRDLATALKNAVQWFDSMLNKFNDFAKAHPLIVHAFQRSLHQVSQGNVGITGALSAVAGDVREAVSGNTDDVDSFGLAEPTGTVQIPSTTVPGSISLMGPPVVNQHNQTTIQLAGIPDVGQALSRMSGAVKDAQTDANNDAFAAVHGGGAP